MNFDELSLAYQLVHHVLPVGLVAVLAGLTWLWACRLLYRNEEALHRNALRLPTNYECLPVETKLALLIERRIVAGRGSPADRLFLGGLAVAGMVSVCALLAYRLVGL